VRLTIHGDKDRRLEVGPWSLDVVAYVVAVLLRRESGCRPLAGIDTKPRTLDVFVIDDPLAVAGRDIVAARVIRNFNDFLKKLVRLLLARALERSGDVSAAEGAYAEALKVFRGEEARYRYAAMLKSLGQTERANVLYRELIKNAERSPRFYQDAQSDWIKAAKRDLAA